MRRYERLFSPIKIGDMEIRNRIVLAPMSTNFGLEGGFVSERGKNYFIERAKGKVGLIVSESNYVSAEGKGGVYRTGLHAPDIIKSHKMLVDAVHKYDVPICAQLHHAGSLASVRAICQYPISCSPVPVLVGGGQFQGNFPRKLSEDEIGGLVEKFVAAALRAREAGYDAVMVHAAHGYLLHQFLSPRTNTRNDGYGGNDENRARFLLETIKEVRKRLGTKFPIMVRLPAREDIPGGCTVEYTKKLAVWLENAGTDEISLSSGSKDEIEGVSPSSSLPEGFRGNEGGEIKKCINIPLGIAGRIMSPNSAERLLKEGKTDLIYIGRSLIADPEFATKAGSGRENEIRPCIVCNTGCLERLRNGVDITCAVNPGVGREGERKERQKSSGKKVVIIGGGPAGMEAARTSSLRGHYVTLIEKCNSLGGALRKAVKLPYKDQLKKLIGYYECSLQKCKVDIVLGTDANSGIVEALSPDVLIAAIGAEPRRLTVPGAGLSHVLFAEDYLRAKRSKKKSVIVVGGGALGLEVADALSDCGKTVSIIEQTGEIGVGMQINIRYAVLERISNKGVKIYVNTKINGITPKGAIVEQNAKEDFFDAEMILLASGYVARRNCLRTINVDNIKYYEIGDCVSPGRIFGAVHDGNRIGNSI